MNKKNTDIEVLKLIYLKYKDYLLPVVVFAISWYVFLNFALPQVQDFLTTKDQIAAQEQTLAQLTQNFNTISAIDSTSLSKQLDIANRALPSEKDFAGILNAISGATGASGVTLNDYTFEIGDINASNNQNSSNQSVQTSLNIKGDINQTKNFLIFLSQQLPLSEVSSVTINTNSIATIVADFFYAPLPKVSFVDTSPIPLLTNSQKQLLQNLVKVSVP